MTVFNHLLVFCLGYGLHGLLTRRSRRRTASCEATPLSEEQIIEMTYETMLENVAITDASLGVPPEPIT